MQIITNTPLRQVPADYCPPGSARWFELSEGHDAGKSMFYYDYLSGQGEPELTVLMVHGNPECSYTYRHIRDALVGSGRCVRIVVMDHIGFGLSDQADFEMVDMHHAANLLQLVRHLDLHDVSLVVHDWGGPIGIGALIEDEWRVRHLAVLNTTIFPMPSTGITYTNFPMRWLPWASTAYVIPDALWGGVAGYVVSHAEPQSSGRFLLNTAAYLLRHATRRIAPGTPEHVWAEGLRSKANARSSKRNVKQTPRWGHGYRYHDGRHGVQDNHAFYQRMQAGVAKAWGEHGRKLPACGFFGQWDACGKDEVIAQWQQALPSLRRATWRYPQVGHFIEEHKGPEIAEALLMLADQA
ncbi:haloalkane dehalogenase [Oceanococcus atlanticus]|uniref:Haloalkane dehalogenase n=1 Tax=Oceanococcus atlanticus TaxID=1317117 RepID=A0A1Y1SAW7_9GAMM|nr:alpha/beta fold hydrolase [Oceanococcus atlanticus]ORE85191.1 haloalkane dehalogenase [Oceanococcus atlanticus]